MDRARELVLRYGWNSTAYQILNPGIEHWFSTSAPGVVGFVRRGRTWVTAGAPVCAQADLPAVVAEFEQAAARSHRRVCYVAAGSRLRDHFLHSPTHTPVVIGAQPAWEPARWPAILRQRRSLRAQLSRARNKGVAIHRQPATDARDDPAFRACLDDWLASRPLPPMHFLVEPAILDSPLDDRLLFVARQEGRLVAFLLASPIPERGGYLVEQIIRSHNAPNGAAELLIDAAMTDLAAAGHRYLTMGLVALATHVQQETRSNPFWLRFLMAWARAHGRRFYHFDGLEHFRTKMCPDAWEPIYAISNEPRFSPRSLYALLAAFAGESLPRTVARGLARAIASELPWLTGAARPGHVHNA
jgi:phosphatidylglycerol lysyltransferase